MFGRCIDIGCVFVVVYIMCQSHAYPQDPGIQQHRNVANQGVANQGVANQDTSNRAENSNLDTIQHAVRQSPTHYIKPAQPSRRAFQRRHSNSSQSLQRTVSNATQPLANINTVPRTVTRPNARPNARLSSSTSRDHARSTAVNGGHGRVLPVMSERVEDLKFVISLGNTTRIDADIPTQVESTHNIEPTNHEARLPDGPIRVEHETREVVRSDGPSSRRVGGAPGRGGSTDGANVANGANVARWNTNKPTPEKQQRAGSRIKLPNEGGIVFPGQEKVTAMNRPRYVPRVSGDDVPHCANGLTFCETAADGYPNDHLRRVLKQDEIVYKQLFGRDELAFTNITQRIDTSEEHQLCLSIEEMVFPKMGLNKDEKWLYIVNQDNYVQGVRIERCRNPDAECNFLETFPFGYRTFCKQKYIYRKLLAVNEDGEPDTSAFKLPACCSCHIMRMDGTSSRMGFNPSTQSPASTTKKRRRRRT